MLNNKFKENWLIAIAVISLCTAISLIFYIKEDNLFVRGDDLSNFPFIFLTFFAIILAPFGEELTFRGFYSSKQRVKIISYILLPIFVLFVASQYWFVIVLYYLTLYLNSKFNRSWLFKLSIIINALLFASIHYEIEDLINFEVVTLPFQLAFGFLSIWIVINFNLLKAIIAHVLWNGVLMFILFLGIQFPDQTINTYKNETITVTWSKSPYFASTPGKFSINEKGIFAENLSVKDLNSFLNLDNTISKKSYQSEPFMKYDFQIKVIDSSLRKKELRILAKKFLEDQKLLVYEKE